MSKQHSIRKQKDMVERFQQGESASSIARSMSLWTTSVVRVLKRYGLKMTDGKGENHSGWKGGRGIKTGYWTVYTTNHPRRLNNGRVFEHILIAEEKIGRPISKGEPIHHIDFDRLNNDPENLYICSSHTEHKCIHFSLESVARDLYRQGIVKFTDGKYHL